MHSARTQARRALAALAVCAAALPLSPGLSAPAHAQVAYRDGAMAVRFGDFVEARKLYRQECDDGDLDSCVGLAHLWRQGRGGEQDLEKAQALFGDACDKGAADACTNGAFLHFEGRDGEKDYEAARALYEKACELDDVSGCAGYGNMLYAGLGGPYDRVEGERLMRRACAQDYDWACEQLRKFGRNRPD